MKQQGFYELQPERVLRAAERLGFVTTGELLQLNSYENRVFSIKLEHDHSYGGMSDQLVGKFYRPNRWSQHAIEDEHQFLFDLVDEGINCVAPIQVDGQSLFEDEDLFFTFFPKCPGRLLQELLPHQLNQVGRILARLHNVGCRSEAEHRMWLDTDYYGGWQTLEDLESWVAPEVKQRYINAGESILSRLDEALESVDYLRVHGDCHRGNLLSDDRELFFIDFDDFINGVAVQDFWMLLSWDPSSIEEEKTELLKGYEELRLFNPYEWQLVDLLRGLRILGYAGWIAARWDDPSFPRLFPQFQSYQYWAEEVEALEKIAWKVGNDPV